MTEGVKLMVEQKDTGWLPVFDKKRIHQVVDILENYGIDSEMGCKDDSCMKLPSDNLQGPYHKYSKPGN